MLAYVFHFISVSAAFCLLPIFRRRSLYQRCLTKTSRVSLPSSKFTLLHLPPTSLGGWSSFRGATSPCSDCHIAQDFCRVKTTTSWRKVRPFKGEFSSHTYCPSYSDWVWGNIAPLSRLYFDSFHKYVQHSFKTLFAAYGALQQIGRHMKNQGLIGENMSKDNHACRNQMVDRGKP